MITVEEIVNAYKTTGRKPCKQVFKDDTRNACCAIGVLAMIEDPIDPVISGYSKLKAKYGYHALYALALGFDEVINRHTVNFEQWHKVGYEAAQIMFSNEE